MTSGMLNQNDVLSTDMISVYMLQDFFLSIFKY